MQALERDGARRRERRRRRDARRRFFFRGGGERVVLEVLPRVALSPEAQRLERRDRRVHGVREVFY